MDQRPSYDTDVIHEVSKEEPFLFEGEKIEYTGNSAMSVETYVIAVPILFVPPLFILWSLLWLGINYYGVKNDKIWLTKKRIVYARKKFPGASYTVTSVPLSKIKSIKQPIGAWEFLNRLFGCSDINVVTTDNRFPRMHIQDVKAAKKFVEAIKLISPELLEGE